MDYEKKYKEALERAKYIYNTPCKPAEAATIKETLTSIFPFLADELAESEDERIRKALIEYFGEQCDMSDWNGVYGYQVLTWLEKQGERLYMNEAKYELLKEDIADGYIDTFVKEGSHNYLKIKIPMILCPTNYKKGDKVKLIIVKEE